jgi:hypothetical protein
LALILLPISAILGVLCYIFVSSQLHSTLGAVLGGAFGICIGLLYFSAVMARISVQGGELRILRAVDEIRVPIDAVVSSRITSVTPRWIVGAVWLKHRKVPILFHFSVIDTTNMGDLKATKTAIERLFRQHAR